MMMMMSTKEKFIEAAKQGEILVRRCEECGQLHASTVYFCKGCGGSRFGDQTVSGAGRVATYTIITVPPAGFERYTPYAFVVMSLEESDLRVSGFMGGIATPEDLPVGTAARVTGYDDRGLLLEKS